MKQYKIEAIDIYGERVTVTFDAGCANSARKEAEEQYSEVISVVPIESSGSLFDYEN